jgi:probable HAF family extracellular repeat protein
MIDLGSLGANFSPGMLDNQGRVYAYGIGADFHPHVLRWDNGVTTDLGALPGFGSLVFSPRGLVAGTACTHDTDTCTFYLFDEGTITTLETDGTASEDQSRVSSVMDDGTVIGVVQYAGREAAVLWQDGVRRELPPLDAFHPYTFPNTMNKQGRLIGQSIDAAFTQSRPYLWEDGVARDLGGLFDHPCAANPDTICGSADVSAINDHGDMVGWSNDVNGFGRAVIWRNGGAVRDLDVFLGEGTSAQDINERGDVYGFGGPDHWFVLIDGVVYHPGAPAGTFSHPAAMNENGEVAGLLRTADGSWHSFVWRKGQMTDLGVGPPGRQSSQAMHINGRGEVLGVYVTPQFEQRLVLWRIK